MFHLKKVVTGLIIGIGLALGGFSPALADDSEIYLNSTPGAGIRPNVLLLVDTSRSMNAPDADGERQPEYSPNSTYLTQNNCVAGRIFFRRKGEAQPDCASTNYILEASNNCAKLAAATLTGAGGGRSGRWTGKAGRFDTSTKTWSDLVGSGTADLIECSADSGNHGANSAPTPNFYARNGNTSTTWTSLPSSSIDWSQRTTYTFYSWKYLNWYRETPATTTVRRIQSVENAVANLISSVDGINMGMMRFNLENDVPGGTEFDYRGGVITNLVKNIDIGRAGLITSITNGGTGNSLGSSGYSPNTGTMLSESLYEAYRYWKGNAVWSGDADGKDTAIGVAGTNYTSPITAQCQKNFQIILTDGRPSVDNQADALIEALPGVGTCTGTPGATTGSPLDPNDGRCLDELAGYMNATTTDLIPGIAGNQQVTTYTIGFGKDVVGADFLDEVAADGGGRRYDAANSSELQDIFDDIASDVLNVATTFSTASVSVNAFNRTSSRDELYFALFAPDERERWDGNLKKYKLAVIDRDGPSGAGQPEIIVTGQGTPADAIDPVTGFFKEGTRSFWSSDPDGNVVADGGAANQLPAYTARVMKTHLGSNPLTPITDAAVTDTMLSATGAAERTAVLDFMRARNEARMGDPMHSVPQVVTYGGTAAAPIDVVFVATNDGVLHAINAADSNGAELWSFIPQELLGRQKQLMDNAVIANRTYGLDGDIRILRYDINSDGTIDSTAGDRVYLYVGMRRGGQYYYALDITSRTAPSLLWKLGPSQLPNLGETWSPPTIARVSVGSAAQNGQKFVLIFGGGYDAAQENYTHADDSVGNRIFMVDAKSGALLWRGGGKNNADTPNLTLNAMSNSIPGKITVLDLDGDHLADRMYAADTGGRVFRFDITNGNPAGTLVTGGVFANLGQGLVGGSYTTPTSITDTRRFYNAPDVALIQSRGAAPYLSVALGSGYRGHPLHKATTDRFYALRDKQPFRRYTKAQYTDGTVSVITDGDTNLVNITSDPAAANVPATAVGWKYEFSARPGEKVLSEATTAGGVALFSTYQPGDPDPSNPCTSQHLNRTYAINIGNGRPALDFNKNNTITNADLFEQVTHAGILGGVNIAVLRGDILDKYKEACAANTANPCTVDEEAKLTCIAGMHVLGRCVDVGDGGRSYWRKRADSGN